MYLEEQVDQKNSGKFFYISFQVQMGRKLDSNFTEVSQQKTGSKLKCKRESISVHSAIMS